jgi:hypothetical protein
MNKWQKLAKSVNAGYDKVEKALDGLEDFGTSNFDAVLVRGFRWCGSLEKAFDEAGIRAWVTTEHGRKMLRVMNARKGFKVGQGARNTTAARTLAESLREDGYDATVRYVTD